MSLLRRYHAVVAYAILAAVMITLVVVLAPTWKTLAMCLVAWLGGVAFILSYRALLRRGRLS